MMTATDNPERVIRRQKTTCKSLFQIEREKIRYAATEKSRTVQARTEMVTTKQIIWTTVKS